MFMDSNKKDYHLDNVKEIGNGKVVIELNLPEGKLTTDGEYPKLNSDDKCAYSKRASCNDGLFFKRCPYMKYDNSQSICSSTRWRCVFCKNIK